MAAVAWLRLVPGSRRRAAASHSPTKAQAIGTPPTTGEFGLVANAQAIATPAANARGQLRAAGSSSVKASAIQNICSLSSRPMWPCWSSSGQQASNNVVSQPAYDSHVYSGLNPYALGFALFADLRRICKTPDAEDRAWFPELAGSDWVATLDFAMRNFKDESFIAQYLSPRLIREFHLFAVADHTNEETLMVDSIHDDHGYRRVRKLLAQQHAQEICVPDVQVVRFERDGDRSLTLRHLRRRGRPLTEAAAKVVEHLRRLWGFAVRLETWENDARVGDVVECPG